jgi:serine/threonine-protein kinase
MQGRLLEGKYRVSRLIGEGGMGTVYEAEHTLIGRAVAVKVLHGDFAKSPEAQERFRREARAATAIRHANIIEVTDMGTTEEGRPFLVMELLEGVPLSALLVEGRGMPLARIVHVLTQVLDALAAAHKKGIVHRDLKPDNVFVVQEQDRPDFVKLLDFGISKMNEATAGGLSVTRTGSVMGTPNYMAPEQAMGRKDCDHRVDLWAVGVMLYEALTGRRPYLGDNYNELLTAILMTTPPTPCTVNPAITPALERVILRALAKERDQRYSSATELRDELRAASAGAAPIAGVLAPPVVATPAPAVAPPAAPRVGPRPAAPAAPPPVPRSAAPAAPPPVPRPAAPAAPLPVPRSAPPAASPPAPAAAAVRPATPTAPLTLTPGAYDAPVLDQPAAPRKRRTVLFAGGGLALVAAVVVAVVLLSAKRPERAEAPPSPGAASGETDVGGVPDDEAGRGDASSDADAGVSPAAADAGPDAAAPDEFRPDAAAAPDEFRPDAAAREAEIDGGAPVRDARPPVDRGRPPARDAGTRPRDTGAASDDGGRPSLRRDYT